MEYYEIKTTGGTIKVASYELARDLEKENEQLKARVLKLEEALADYAHHPHTCPAWEDPDSGECDCGCSDVLEVLDRTPAQSLANIKAGALRDEACFIARTFGDCENVVRSMRAKADQIEQEEKNEL